MLIATRDASAHYFRSAQLYVVRPHVQIEINVCHMYSGRLMCELLSKLMSDDWWCQTDLFPVAYFVSS